MFKLPITIILLCFLPFSCDNPFLPETVSPLTVSENRETPDGVISQLFQSYETRRIELFTDVLSKNDFKFYTASDFDRTNATYQALLSEKPDTFMTFVNTGNLYYYWEYSAEVNSTSNLFSNAELIDIPSRPSISEIHYITDTSGDTVYAEVKINDVTFEVSRYETVSGTKIFATYSLVNQPQVFLLEKDDDNLWVICKWFDLGSESSN